MTLIAQMGALLLQGVQAAAETTVVKPATVGPAWYTTLNQIIGAASVIVFLVLMVILIPAVVKFRKTATKFEAVLDHIERSIDPVTKHASNIANNIDYITTSIRADVQAIRKTLLVANDGIRDVIDSSERRLHEMGAVLRMVQEEAEHAFVSTASTLAGVRAGAAAFREDGARLADADDANDDESLDTLDADAFDDLDDLDDDLDEDLESVDDDSESDLNSAVDAAEDITDGYDNGSTLGRAKPRIKRPNRGDAG
ncbi:MAG TPA: DUF948 domain-containing protein [Gemmatimonadaceae bacterium]|nr:DUF948 domain-containing protein [Gemmatimonadaceae bacterium]